jgi:TonB family protein
MRCVLLVIAVLAGAVAEGQSPESDIPLRIGNGVTAPKIINKVEPIYTPEARHARLEGTVVLSVVVGRDGVPSDIRVLRPLAGLEDEAIEAVRRWRFKPGEKDGKPVPVIAQIEINFRLPVDNEPLDVPLLDIKPGRYEFTSTRKTEKDETTRKGTRCITAGAWDRTYYIPPSADPGCRRTVVAASSKEREITLTCSAPDHQRETSVRFEFDGRDGFTVFSRSKFGTTGDVSVIERAKWVAEECAARPPDTAKPAVP